MLLKDFTIFRIEIMIICVLDNLELVEYLSIYVPQLLGTVYTIYPVWLFITCNFSSIFSLVLLKV